MACHEKTKHLKWEYRAFMGPLAPRCNYSNGKQRNTEKCCLTHFFVWKVCVCLRVNAKMNKRPRPLGHRVLDIDRALRVLLPCVADLSAEESVRLAKCPGWLWSMSTTRQTWPQHRLVTGGTHWLISHALTSAILIISTAGALHKVQIMVWLKKSQPEL